MKKTFNGLIFRLRKERKEKNELDQSKEITQTETYKEKREEEIKQKQNI